MQLTDWTLQIIAILGFATAISTLFNYLKIPTIVGFIASGLLIGPYCLGIVSSFPGIEIINEIGLSLLMFTVGLEFSTDKIKYLSRSLLGLGLGMIVIITGLCFLIGVTTGMWTWQMSIFIGMITSLSSSAIVMKLLQKKRELETPHGNACVGILLAQDIAFAPMILSIGVITSMMVSEGSKKLTSVNSIGGSGVLDSLIQLSVCLLAAFLLYLFTKHLLNKIFILVLNTRSQELFFILLFLMFSVIAFGTEALLGSLSLGSFIAGLCFANSPLAKQALSDILPLRDTFLGMLFASVGMMVDLNYFAQNFFYILLGTGLILLIKPSVVYVLGRVQKYTHSVSLIAGLLTFQVGEFSIVLIKELSKRQYFSSDEVNYFLAITVLTMALTPFVQRMIPWITRKTAFLENFSFALPMISTTIVNANDKTQEQIDYNKAKGLVHNDHTVIIGYGLAGVSLGKILDEMRIPYIAIEMNYSAVLKAQSQGHSVIYGDAQRQEILHIAGIEKARCIVITIPSVAIACNVISQARHIVPHITVIIRVEYQRGTSALSSFSPVEAVVGEHESSIQVLWKTLNLYGISQEIITKKIDELRNDWCSSNDLWFDDNNYYQFTPFLGERDIKNYTISIKSYAYNKSISDLNVKVLTNAWIVAIQRGNKRPFVPSSNYKLDSGDILYVKAKEHDYHKLVNYLDQGLDKFLDQD